MTASDLTILQAIQAKLPTTIFDNDTFVMDGIINDVCIEMETCFRVRFYLDVDNIQQEDWSRVGDELKYNPIQRSIIGDFAAWRYLLRKLIDLASTLGVAIQDGTGGDFLKKAKAGMTEAEFEQMELKHNPMIIHIGSLLSQLKADVMRKARNVGCIIDVNADNVYKIELEQGLMEFPMLMIRENCGCHGY